MISRGRRDTEAEAAWGWRAAGRRAAGQRPRGPGRPECSAVAPEPSRSWRGASPPRAPGSTGGTPSPGPAGVTFSQRLSGRTPSSTGHPPASPGKSHSGQRQAQCPRRGQNRLRLWGPSLGSSCPHPLRAKPWGTPGGLASLPSPGRGPQGATLKLRLSPRSCQWGQWPRCRAGPAPPNTEGQPAPGGPAATPGVGRRARDRGSEVARHGPCPLFQSSRDGPNFRPFVSFFLFEY